MRSFASRTGVRVAVAAAAMSIVSAVLIPYGYPWPSLAWAVLACGAAVWVAKDSIHPARSMSDVISDVEAEPVLAGAPASGRGALKTRVIL
jgi:hypothetical protein